MSSDTVFSSVRSFLENDSGWDRNAVPLVFENEDFTPPAPDPDKAWVLVEMTGNFYEPESIGAGSDAANRYGEEGQIFFHVMVPKGVGSQVARQYGRQLVDLFRGRELDSGKITFPSSSIGRGEPGDEDGVWWRLGCSVVYDAQHF